MNDQSPVRNIRQRVLSAADHAVSADREGQYGAPTHNLGLAGELKRVIRTYWARDAHPGEEHAVEEALMKIARIVTSPKPVLDNYVDLCGYAALAAELAFDTSEVKADIARRLAALQAHADA